jgi:hypothetical protein
VCHNAFAWYPMKKEESFCWAGGGSRECRVRFFARGSYHTSSCIAWSCRDEVPSCIASSDDDACVTRRDEHPFPHIYYGRHEHDLHRFDFQNTTISRNRNVTNVIHIEKQS